jgi:zinc protease
MKRSDCASLWSRSSLVLPCWIRFSLLGVLQGVVLVATALSQSVAVRLPNSIERVTSVEGIAEYRLTNGLRVLLFPDPSKQTLTVNITYLVGSLHENYGETGMAHLLEHLVFKGTPNHTDIPKELSEHGTRPNGTTWLDRTNYFETFQASDANLEWALDLEADRMVNSFIAKKDLDSEMTVVRNEFEAGENYPVEVLMQRTISTAFLWHNYGKSTIGARSDIENVSIDRLQAFYHTYYQPDNAILLIAGKLDEQKVLGLVSAKFGAIPKPSRTLPKLYTTEPVQDGERFVTLRRVGDVQALLVAYHIPAGSHPDFAAIDLLSRILGDTPSGRLHKALVETKKASSVFGFNFQLREPGVAMWGAEVRQPASLDEAREVLLKTIDGVVSKPPTQEEVERARGQILKQIDLNLNSSDRVGLQMSEWMAMGDWRLFFLHRDRVKKATVEDVLRAAKAYLKPSNRTLGQFIPTTSPDRSEIPPIPDVSEMLKDYKGETQISMGEDFDPSPSNIESRTTRSRLPNGLKLALLPKKTRGDNVVAALALHYGDEKSLLNQQTVAELTSQMLMRGTTKHTRQQVQDELDKLKARVSFFGKGASVNVSLETKREFLPAVFKLVGEVLREPSFPPSEFDQLKEEQLAQIEQQRTDPQPIAFNAVQRHLNPYPKGDVRYVPTFEEEIQEVKSATLAQVKSFYRGFYGASDGELAVVGDFDDREIAGLASELLGSWKSPRSFSRVVSFFRPVEPVSQSFETPDKANAVFTAGMNLKLRDDDPDYPALTLGNYILGSGLNSRLFKRIREKEGISYGVGSQLNASPQDRSGVFMGFAIYAPQNVQKLEAAFREELEKALKEGFTDDELSVAKAGYAQSRQVSRAQDNELVRKMASYLFIDRNLGWDAEFEKKVATLTPEQISTALRKHLDLSKLSVIKAGDFAKLQAARK